MPIKDNSSVLPGVGVNVQVDHVAIQVASGMMIAARTLFTKLGYTEMTSRRVSGDWGFSSFMVKKGSIHIQLSESSDPTEILEGEGHLAIGVADPRLVVHSAVAFLNWAGQDATFEEVGEQKYFLYVPTILIQPLEFVRVSLI